MPAAPARARAYSCTNISTPPSTHAHPGAPTTYNATTYSVSATRSTTESRTKPNLVVREVMTATAPSRLSTMPLSATTTTAASTHRPPSQASHTTTPASTPPSSVIAS